MGLQEEIAEHNVLHFASENKILEFVFFFHLVSLSPGSTVSEPSFALVIIVTSANPHGGRELAPALPCG